MDRRQWLTRLGLSAGAVGIPLMTANSTSVLAQETKSSPSAAKDLPPLKITDVKTILTAPANIRLVVVKVTTNEPGLYGLGCATFTQRARVVKTAVDEFLRPFLIGKNPLNIEDVWQSSYVSSYWRNGSTLYSCRAPRWKPSITQTNNSRLPFPIPDTDLKRWSQVLWLPTWQEGAVECVVMRPASWRAKAIAGHA